MYKFALKLKVFFCRFVDLGGNFVDTADVYCDGQSEEIVGTWLQKMGPKREQIVVATKGRYA